jgi:hypothetical protein
MAYESLGAGCFPAFVCDSMLYAKRDLEIGAWDFNGH